MNTTALRLRGEASEYRLLFSPNTDKTLPVLEKPDTSAAEEFAPLEASKNAWVYIELDAEQVEEIIDPYLEALTNNSEHVVTADYQRADVLYHVDGETILFKKLGANNRIHEKGTTILQFSDEGASATQYSFALNANDQADAYYDGIKKRLYFTKFSRIRSMFKGIDEVYQDATIADKEKFLYTELFELGDNMNINYIGLSDTKKLIHIQESQVFDFSDEQTRHRITAYAVEYPSAGVGVNDEGRIIINTKKDLTSALKLLGQKFFTAELTGEKFEATNAKRMKD